MVGINNRKVKTSLDIRLRLETWEKYPNGKNVMKKEREQAKE